MMAERPVAYVPETVNESKIGTSECKADMPVDRPEEILRSIDQVMTEAASLFSTTPSVDFQPDLHSQALELSDSMMTDKSDFLDTSSSASFESSMSSAGAESASSAVLTGKRKRGRPPKEGSRKRERASAEPSALAETITTSAPEQVVPPTEVKIENVAETAVAPTTTIKKGPVAKKARDTYYCKHCDTTFPVGFFRNVQQFGAHCSNCSRGRSLQTPDDTYAQRLPTRLQRALKRKKRQEEGTLPRKRGRKARAEKKARQPRERVKQKRYVEQWDSSDEDNKRYRKRERRGPAQYDDSYVYEYNDRRRLARKTHWNDIQLAKRGPRPSYSSQLALQPMSVNQVDELPQKLLLRIFSFLDKAGDLAKAGMTCRLFGRIYNHDSLWKRLFCREWKESIGYAFTGKWKARYRARLQYIESRRRPDNLPSLRLDTPMASASEQSSEDGSFCSLPPVKTLTPAPAHAHWLAEKIVDSQPKVDPITGKSRMEYLIKWEGFGDEWNSWLNEEDVWCKELIEEYNSGKITVPPSASKKRRSHSSSSNAGARVWEAGYGDEEEEEGEDFYARARRKTARLANTGTGGGGKGNLFIRGQEGEYLLGGDEDSSASSSLSFGSTLWELDLDLDEDLWRETWDPRGESLMSEDESDSEEYEEVPVTKEEKEKQQQEFLRSLEANPNYKPVILFFEKS